MTRKLSKSILVVALYLSLTAGASAAQNLLNRFESAPAPFSPNGDGYRDTTSVSYGLLDAADELSIVVFAADSITPVDTLVAPAPDLITGIKRVTWRGTRWDGTSAPEGTYVITINADGATRPDTTVSRLVFLDITMPMVTIGVAPDPDPFAPNLAGSNSVLSVWFTATQVSPAPTGRTRDRVVISYFNPTGTPVVYDTAKVKISPALSGGVGRSIIADGDYEITWDAADQSGLVDGEYTVEVTIDDAATGLSTAAHSANFDMTRPALEFTSLARSARVAVVPDSLHGWTWDRNNIDTLSVRYRDGGPFVDVVSRQIVADTLFFAVPLADSFTTTGDHELGFRSVDRARRVNNSTFDFTYDLTATSAPTLTPFNGVWRSSTFPLQIQFVDEGSPLDRIRIYRNGSVVDSAFTFGVEGSLSRDVQLIVGRNTITVTLVDGADNESAHSNAVVADYSDNSGLFIPSPFRPDNAFNVNVSTAAALVALRIYDLTGDLVTRMDSDARRTDYVFTWDGLNGSGESTKKGPLVAIATVQFDDGSKQVYRELFLYEPN